ncbi:MAG TPA: response regulator [Candidatus Acidoferrum sp.]|jgi:CheY-like chemotaxis protein|nr:response regulator [Candidatus Acidoferrum sp.]
MTILVVDDEPAVRSLVEAILKGAGHSVSLASNGLEGVSLYRSSPTRFDLVLTDLGMPVMDGHQLVKLIRETNASARIICMSGYTDLPLPANVDFLQKPFAPSDLRACVDNVLCRP